MTSLPEHASPDDPADEDPVDETSEESFPASDPPSWTMGVDHHLRDVPPPPPPPKGTPGGPEPAARA